MIRVAIVTDAWTPQVNGVVTTLVETLRRVPDGFVVAIIDPSLFRTISLPNYPEIKLAINPWKMDLSEYDSIHIATEGPLGWWARRVCKRNGWAFTTGYHTNFPDYINKRTGLPAGLIVPLIRHFHRGSAAVMVPTSSTKHKLDRWGFKSVIVWGRGFDPEVFYPPEQPVDRLRTDSPLELLYVGRVSCEKNLEALLGLPDRVDDPQRYFITIVGDGPDRPELQRKYPRARFVGYKHGRDLAEFYRAADVFVFPSLSDTFGIVMVEAMACGCPVAAFDVEGPKDVVTIGGGGELAYGTTAWDLESAIDQCVFLEQRGILRNAAKHTWEKSADTFYSAIVDRTTGLPFMGPTSRLASLG